MSYIRTLQCIAVYIAQKNISIKFNSTLFLKGTFQSSSKLFYLYTANLQQQGKEQRETRQKLTFESEQ